MSKKRKNKRAPKEALTDADEAAVPAVDASAESSDDDTPALVKRESLAAAGFVATEDEQKKFTSRLLARAYSRMDLPRIQSPLFGAGAALAAAGALVSSARGQPFAVAIAAGAAAIMGVAFVAVAAAEKKRRAKGDTFDPRGCYLNDEGELRPALDDNEKVLLVRRADGRDRVMVRAVSGAFQATWGVLLAGLPLATVGPGSVAGAALALAGTLLGAGMFGRGIRTIFFHGAIQSWALTNQRLVGMIAPGSAVSVELRRLRHRPTLVGRADGTVTFGAEVRPLSSAAPLPMMGLIGFDAVSDAEGAKWANATMDARKALMDDD